MNKSTLFTLGTVALTSLFQAAPSYADGWDLANNPDNFNVNWHPTNYNYRFDSLPTSGGVPTEQTPWGDSYWPKNRGGFSYRWHEFQESGMSQELTQADRNRLFFQYKLYSANEIANMSRDQLAKLSPLEKYSIVIGDFKYKLVQEYRSKNAADDAYWEGYCHAWSAASAHYTEPTPVDVDVIIGGKRVTVPFGAGDVKALLTAHYADLDGWTNVSGKFNKFKRFFNKKVAPKVEIRYVGNMCKKTFTFPVTKMKNGIEVLTDYSDTDGVNDTEIENLARQYQADVLRVLGSKDPRTLTSDEADRLKQAKDPLLASQARLDSQDPACADTNAGAFHVVMANQLGVMKENFLIDKTRDGEIWNQPVYKFETKVVGETAPTGKAAKGTAKMVEMDTTIYYADDTDYGWSFWNPSLSGIFGAQNYFTSFMDEYNKYQDMLIKEGDLEAREEYPEHVLAHANYRYRLELDVNNRIIGGQWLTLDRPDDLYFVKKAPFAGDFSELGRIYRPMRAQN